MAIVEGQLFEIKWNNNNKDWLTSRGYEYTRHLDTLLVRGEDLTPTSQFNLKFYCDDCGEIDTISNRYYQKAKDNNKNVLCKECKYKHIQTKRIKTIKSSYGDVISVYEKVLSGKLKEFPDGFMTNVQINEACELVRLMVELMIDNKDIDSVDDLPTKIRDIHFKKYKLYSLLKSFGLIELIQNSFPNKWHVFEFHQLPKGFWDNKENQKDAIMYLFNILKNEKVVETFDEIPRKLTYNLLVKNKMVSLLKMYNSIPTMVMELFPDRFNEWEFNVVKGYYQSDDNKRKVMGWFIGQLLNDKVIESIEDIPNVVCENTFKQYGLIGALKSGFNYSSFQAINFMFPNKWKPWEFRNITNGFWDNANNVRETVVWVVEKSIEKGIIKRIPDLQNMNLAKLFRNFKLDYLYDRYDIPFCLSMIYGDQFNHTIYKDITSELDGQKVDSYEELEVHNIIANNFNNYSKPSQNERFYNKTHKESYVPDWIINNNLIVEYFGLYSEDSKSQHLKKYRNKTRRKIEYFNSLDGYKFIGIFSDDLNDNYKGIVEKFKKYNIDLNI